jgi:hypothetical protein
MAYCARCRIGAVDERGLCALCGASSTPPTRAERVAEAGGAFLATMLSPGVAGAALFVVLVIAVAGVTRYGHVTPLAMRRLPMPDPAAVAALVRTNPAGAAVNLLLGAVIQALLFLLLVLAIFFILRRRSTRAPDHTHQFNGQFRA